MSDSTPEGKVYNDKVFAVIKDWIHNVLSPSSDPYTSKVMANRFAESATNILSQRGYLDNIRTIELEQKGQEFMFVPKRADEQKKIKMTSSNNEKFYSNLEDFRPAVRYPQIV